MNRRTIGSSILLLALLLLLGASPALADGDGDAQSDAASRLSAEAAGVFAPRLSMRPLEVAPAPFTLLTPIRDLLSGSIWLY